jgi:hypothetical protein
VYPVTPLSKLGAPNTQCKRMSRSIVREREHLVARMGFSHWENLTGWASGSVCREGPTLVLTWNAEKYPLGVPPDGKKRGRKYRNGKAGNQTMDVSISEEERMLLVRGLASLAMEGREEAMEVVVRLLVKLTPPERKAVPMKGESR